MSGIHRKIPFLFGARAATQAYYEKVLATATANLAGYWRLNEVAGATAADSSTQSNDGAYTGVDLANHAGPDSVLVPFFDGANDCVDLYSSDFNGDFNGQEGTFAIWMKVDEVATWNAAGIRQICLFYSSTDCYIQLRKENVGNTFAFWYTANGATDTVVVETVSDVGWIHIALTWSEAADELKAYWNGVQIGTTQGTLGGAGAWSGVLVASGTVLGSSNVTPANVWKGYLAHAAVWNTPLTGPQILALATV